MIVAAPIPTGLFWCFVAVLLALVFVSVLYISFELIQAAVEWWDRWRYGA